MTWRRAPAPLAGAVEQLAARLEPVTTLARVQRAWPAVGLAAEHARPVAERGGVVTVACESATWAQELDLMAPELVGALNDALGTPLVTALTVRGPARRRRR